MGVWTKKYASPAERWEEDEFEKVRAKRNLK